MVPLVFVSYAEEDRPAAERIARALAECGWDVWWDRRIGPGQQYDTSIAAALRSAGAVVVLWSRHSVASEWVREEALHGKQRGVLVPVSLDRSDPPLGFGLRQAVDLSRWNGATDWPEFTTLVTAITALVAPGSASESPPLRSDSNSRRQSRFLTGRWTLPIGVALASLLSLSVLGFLYWDAYYREHVEYFANVTRRWGFPEGRGALTAAQVDRRNVTLALVRHGRRNPVHELRLVDSRGNTPPTGTYMPPISLIDLNPLAATGDQFVTELGLTRMTFSRDASGRILEQAAFTRGGRRVYTLHFTTPDLAEYKSDGVARPVRESGITYIRFSRISTGPNAGLDERYVYLDANRKPQPDERNAYGYRTVVNDKGLVTEKIRLGPALEDAPESAGVFKEVLSHDVLANVTEGWTFDRHNTRIRGRTGSAGGRYEYDDEVGNLVRLSFYDEDGLLVSLPDLGAAGRTFTYDDSGHLKSGTFFGPDRRLVNGNLGFATQTIEWLAPNRGLARFFGPDERPLPVLGGAFEGIETFDARGLPIETVYRDKNGRPTRLDNGCSTVRLAYDDVGNNIRTDCLDEDANPTLSVRGDATSRIRYDEVGNPVSTSFFDVRGQPGLQGESFTTVRRTFNVFGKVVTASYVDTDGKPRRTRSGEAGATYTYDTRGNRISETYVDEHGRPTAITAGCAGVTSEYDARGLEITSSFIDTAGRPCRHNDGYASAAFRHDASGFVERASLRDTRGRPVTGTDGFAGWVVKRNSAGLRLETTFLDEQGRPTIARRLGTCRRRWVYDAAGRVVARSDHDTAGRPVNNAFGYSTIKYIYDEYGQETGREIFDLAGRALPVVVTVDKVVSGSVAADSGFRPGDVILAYDGETVRTTHQFTNTLEVFKGNRGREVRVDRGGVIVALDISAGRLNGLLLEEAARR